MVQSSWAEGPWMVPLDSCTSSLLHSGRLGAVRPPVPNGTPTKSPDSTRRCPGTFGSSTVPTHGARAKGLNGPLGSVKVASITVAAVVATVASPCDQRSWCVCMNFPSLGIVLDGLALLAGKVADKLDGD